ncbi:MAG: ParA family protein [Defluviitaleaceae bacterium]|nr:ParA family protein [Defluviitaleaceae bacterium]
MNKKYVVWNNKGGVGKTFTTYCMSTEYAKEHPNTRVVVVDMCPQSNISTMLLGGNGPGADNSLRLMDNKKTIAGYIQVRESRSRRDKTGSELEYFIKPCEYNQNMPPNLYLVAGDIDLDLCSELIRYMEISPQKDSWRISRKLLSDLITSFEDKYSNEKCVFFIDCNPSFSNYTELAILSANNLIIPCTADPASLHGMKNVSRILYKKDINNGIYVQFNEKAEQEGFVLPRFYAYINNKNRTKDRKSAIAFKAASEDINRYVTENFDASIKSFEIKDCNTLAVIMDYNGIKPSNLTASSYKTYGRKVQASDSQIKPFREDLEKIINML